MERNKGLDQKAKKTEETNISVVQLFIELNSVFSIFV